MCSTHSQAQCSARAAQGIWEHHRPAVGSSMHVFGSTHSTSEKLNPRPSRGQTWQPCRGQHHEGTSQQQARHRHPLYQVQGWGYWEAEISLVIGINQTSHPTNQERPCTTSRRIKKELSVCPSQQRPGLVSFPVLGQIKPHTPRLVVPFRQFL